MVSQLSCLECSSGVYVCDRRHQIIAHDPSILSQVKSILPIPFVLFHKAGVTRELHSFIISHVNAGLTISELQTLWLQTMYDAYGSRREAYISAWNKNSNICLSFPEVDQRLLIIITGQTRLLLVDMLYL